MRERGRERERERESQRERERDRQTDRHTETVIFNDRWREEKKKFKDKGR